MMDLDFRNQPLTSLVTFFSGQGYNAAKLKAFQKAFRSQPLKALSELKGVKNFRELAAALPFTPLELVHTVKDDEQNEKFVFKTHDRQYIESVYMPGREGATGEAQQSGKKSVSICVSVQIGCKLNCRFCTTAKLGFKRDLYAHEIIEQVRQIYQLRIGPARLGCVSFMGMGEPLANLDNCMLAVDWLNSTWGWQVSREKITFSTSGAIPLTDFLAYPRLPNLALSLHAAREDKRRSLMPACRLSLEKLRQYLSAYITKAKRQPTIEYILFRDFNDTPADALALAAYLKDLTVKVNLLNYNPSPCASAPAPGTHNTLPLLEPVSGEKIQEFKSRLSAMGINVLYRRSLGIGIGAGCGQLGKTFI